MNDKHWSGVLATGVNGVVDFTLYYSFTHSAIRWRVNLPPRPTFLAFKTDRFNIKSPSEIRWGLFRSSN